MNLLQMSFFGAVIIVTVMLIRTAVYDRLPKRTFDEEINSLGSSVLYLVCLFGIIPV